MRIAFTLVLNGMPYIKQQAEIIPGCFDKWYIVEGVALPVKDTSWCGLVPAHLHDQDYLSVDGTKEFLDSIASDKIVIIRNNGQPWQGKISMCNSFMDKVEHCTLMEFDSDEIWNTESLNDLLNWADKIHGEAAAAFKCNYFVGPDLIITSRNTYGDNYYEWFRLWKIDKRTEWLTHEPPAIRFHGTPAAIPKQVTELKGWTFDHYAYALESQVAFKEQYYKYNGAVEKWKEMQNSKEFPCLLSRYLPWVRDSAIVDRIIL